ncbi:hypothetical protein EJB05_00489, partial [Eragrostis curvula]
MITSGSSQNNKMEPCFEPPLKKKPPAKRTKLQVTQEDTSTQVVEDITLPKASLPEDIHEDIPEDNSTTGQLCQRCKSGIAGSYDLQLKEELEKVIQKHITALSTAMKEGFKELHNLIIDALQQNTSARFTQNPKQRKLQIPKRKAVEEGCQQVDDKNEDIEEVDMSAKKDDNTNTKVAGRVRPPSGRQSKPHQDTEQYFYPTQKQKQRRRTKDNFPNWPDPKQSTSDDYMIKPSDYETIEYMKQASADDILVDYGNFRCNKKELGCLLNPTEFINNETANVAIRLLKEKWYKREREDGSVYLETAYASKMLWRDGTPTDPKEKTEEDEQKDEADQDQINFIGRRKDITNLRLKLGADVVNNELNQEKGSPGCSKVINVDRPHSEDEDF